MLPRPLNGDWLCVTLLMATCDVRVMLFIDKTILYEVILFKKKKQYHIKLDKLYANICYLLIKSSHIIKYKHCHQCLNKKCV